MTKYVVARLERNPDPGLYKLKIYPQGSGRFNIGYGIEHRVVSYPWQDNVERSGAPNGLTLTETLFTFHLFIVWSFGHVFKFALECGDDIYYDHEGNAMCITDLHIEDEEGRIIKRYV